MRLIFATNNQHKLQEVQNILGPKWSLLSLQDIQFFKEIPETTNTFHGNASQKAQTVYQDSKQNVFADDSGLVVESLNGAPGVDSAHYSGKRDANKNIQKLLKALENHTNRRAYFISVFCLILEGKEYFFDGKVHGKISLEIKGKNGFGYDPVFVPNPYNQSFAELGNAVKNKISHRALALQKMLKFLQAQQST